MDSQRGVGAVARVGVWDMEGCCHQKRSLLYTTLLHLPVVDLPVHRAGGDGGCLSLEKHGASGGHTR